MLELRVLTGTHAGARVLLPEQPQLLGSASDCDLILSDEGLQPHHAEIAIREEDGAIILRWLEPPEEEVVLQAGEGVELGPVRIAIETADSPWRDDPPLRGRSPLPVNEAADGGQSVGANGTPANKNLSSDSTSPSLSRNTKMVAWSLGGLGVCAVAAVLMMQFTPWETDAAAPNSGQAATPAPSPMAQAMTAIEPLGLGRRARVEADNRLGLRVRAAYLNDSQAAALREALGRLPQPPRLEIVSPSQIQASLEDALLLQEGQGGSRLALVPLADGRFRIDGRVGSTQQGEELLALLAKAAPLVQGLESGLRTDEDEARALLQALRALGLGEIEGEWVGGRLELRARVAPAQLPNWERGLAAAVASHPVPIRVTLGPAAAPVAAVPPFSLRSVVGGAMPFVTLADGRRLAIDGQAEGWRLLAIRPEAVVFENAQGLRFTQER